MITYQDEKLGEITVLGFLLKIGSDFYDLKDKELPNNIKFSLKISTKEVVALLQNISEALGENHNWGYNELDWNYGLTSPDYVLRAMTAYSGKYPESAAKDSNHTVRMCAVFGLINKKEDGSDVLNRKWLDKLVNDEDKEVRFQVARYGKKEHLDIMINDDFDDIRAHIAIHGTDEHRTALLNDPSIDVKIAIATHGTDEHRNALLNDPSIDVKIAIATHGTNDQRAALLTQYDCNKKVKLAVLKNTPQTLDLIKELARDKDRDVRLFVANEGVSEFVAQTDLAYDDDPMIRLQLAFRGINIDRLIHDEYASIKSAAESYPNIVGRISLFTNLRKAMNDSQ